MGVRGLSFWDEGHGLPFVSVVERGLVRHCKSNSSSEHILGTALILRRHSYVSMSRTSWSSSMTLDLGSRTGRTGPG